ncbi:hypothetical protein DPMN_147548 [Dreissena polymorpha]|uniref:Uncharacterized protein n=1 Tax=Dreissena polymorpha TaxID=45954 RepID=A0A9D4F7Y4_DREPO|nr:hypothetical protein DPMN_147548 [Dreissena polymorpha]
MDTYDLLVTMDTRLTSHHVQKRLTGHHGHIRLTGPHGHKRLTGRQATALTNSLESSSFLSFSYK